MVDLNRSFFFTLLCLFLTLLRIFNIPVHVNGISPLKEIEEVQLSHAQVIILLDGSQLLEDAFELIELMHDIDVTWMDIEKHLLGLV